MEDGVSDQDLGNSTVFYDTQLFLYPGTDCNRAWLARRSDQAEWEVPRTVRDLERGLCGLSGCCHNGTCQPILERQEEILHTGIRVDGTYAHCCVTCLRANDVIQTSSDPLNLLPCRTNGIVQTSEDPSQTPARPGETPNVDQNSRLS